MKNLERYVITVAGCAAFMNILDLMIVNVSLPSLTRDLAMDTSSSIYLLLVYSITLAGTVLAAGKIADGWGMRPVMAWGFMLFTASSLLCGLAPSLLVMLAGRFLQGIGGGILSATSLGIIGRYLPPSRRGWAVGIVSAASALGATLGNPLGGFLTEYLGWRWIFLVNIPVGLAAWGITVLKLPAHDQERQGKFAEKLDGLGILLNIGALGSLVYAVTKGPRDGWLSSHITASVLLSAACWLSFIFREKRSVRPLMDLELLRNRRFLLANLANFFTAMLISGISFLLPFYFMFVKGLNQAATGMVLMVFSGVYVLISPVAGRLSDRVGASHLSFTGMVLAVLGILGFLPFINSVELIPALGLLVIMGLAYGIYLSPNNRLILSLAPAEKQGGASGMLRLFFYMGQPLGVALAESVFQTGFSGAGFSPAAVQHIGHDVLIPSFQSGFELCAGFAFASACCTLISWAGSRPERRN